MFEVPPGVDVDEFVPQEREEALAELLAEARADPPNPGNAERAAARRGQRRAARGASSRRTRPTVVYFGKLIENKGVQLLLEALDDARRARA